MPVFPRVVAVLVLASSGAARPATTPSPTMTVTYRGIPFPVDRTNPAYDPGQVEQIRRLAMGVPAPESFATFAELCTFHASVVVPGAGASSGGFGDVTDAGQFTQISWQIPTRARHRVLVYRRAAPEAPYRLVDDFLYTGADPPLLTFRTEHGVVACRDLRNGHLLRTFPPAAARGGDPASVRRE